MDVDVDVDIAVGFCSSWWLMVIVVIRGFDGCRRSFWGLRLMVLWWFWLALLRMVMVATVVLQRFK